jgi:hypothetical protein
VANVFGRFSTASPMTFIPLALVSEAAAREPQVHASDGLAMGVDVARFGDDESVIWYRKGRDASLIAPEFFRGIDTMQFASRVIERRGQFNADAVFIDGGGVGGGVVDRCRQLHCNVMDVQFGGKSDRLQEPGLDQIPCANKATEMWLSLRQWLKHGTIPDDQQLHAQLTSRKYGFKTIDGRDHYILEPKDELKRRGLPSPDRADALALTFAYPVIPHRLAGGLHRTTQVESEYEPIWNSTNRRVEHEYDPLA